MNTGRGEREEKLLTDPLKGVTLYPYPHPPVPTLNSSEVPPWGDTVPLSPPPCSYPELIRGPLKRVTLYPYPHPLFLPWTHQRSLHGVTLYPYLHPPVPTLNSSEVPSKGWHCIPNLHPPVPTWNSSEVLSKGWHCTLISSPLFLPWTHPSCQLGRPVHSWQGVSSWWAPNAPCRHTPPAPPAHSPGSLWCPVSPSSLPLKTASSASAWHHHWNTIVTPLP